MYQLSRLSTMSHPDEDLLTIIWGLIGVTPPNLQTYAMQEQARRAPSGREQGTAVWA